MSTGCVSDARSAEAHLHLPAVAPAISVTVSFLDTGFARS